MIELNKTAFQTQAFAHTRYIDPLQYDWPLDHWDRGEFPWQHSETMPLPFIANRANLLATFWRGQLHTAIGTASGLLHFQTNVSPTAFHFLVSPTGAPSIDVTFSSRKPKQKFGAIIWAAGFGAENRLVLDYEHRIYEGQPFWGPDQFQAISSSNRVLISGGGDGGLQDYIRVVTRRDTPKEIIQRLSLPTTITGELLCAEDRTHRGRSWAGQNDKEVAYLHEVEQIQRGAVSVCLGDSNIIAALHALIPSIPDKIELVYRGKMLDAYYGLNRFLVLLIAEFILKEYGVTTLYPETEIVEMTIPSTSQPRHDCLQLHPLPHPGGTRGSGYTYRAAGTYVGGHLNSNNEYEGGILVQHDCFGKEHQVSMHDSANDTYRHEIFDVIIIRHGINRNRNDPMPTRHKHLLPYHIPVV
ncbi:MAG: hypothetical protein ABSC06_03675 [Rhodopila sp.]